MPITQDIADQLTPHVMRLLQDQVTPVTSDEDFVRLIVHETVEALMNYRSWAERPWLSDEQVEAIDKEIDAVLPDQPPVDY